MALTTYPNFDMEIIANIKHLRKHGITPEIRKAANELYMSCMGVIEMESMREYRREIGSI